MGRRLLPTILWSMKSSGETKLKVFSEECNFQSEPAVLRAAMCRQDRMAPGAVLGQRASW